MNPLQMHYTLEISPNTQHDLVFEPPLLDNLQSWLAREWITTRFLCKDLEHRSFIHLQLLTLTNLSSFILVSSKLQIWTLHCCSAGRQFVQKFSTAPIQKSNFIQVLIDGAMGRAKPCQQFTSAGFRLLLHQLMQHPIVHNRLTFGPWLIVEAVVAVVEKPGIFCCRYWIHSPSAFNFFDLNRC